jgi:hypothetical protein
MRPLHLAAALLAAIAWRAVPGGAAEPIRPSEAAQHVGEEVVVDGTVNAAVCSPQACLLSFAPNFSGLVVAIAGADVGRFPPVKQAYEGQRVRVHGTVGERNGKPRIEVEAPTAIEIVPTAAAEQGATAAGGDRNAAGEPDAGGDRSAAKPGAGDDRSAAAAPAQRPLVVPVPAVTPIPPGTPLTRERAAALVGVSLAAMRKKDVQVEAEPAPEDAGVSVDASAELQLLRQQVAILSDRLAAAEERLAEMDERVAAVESEPAAPPAAAPGALSAFENRRGIPDLQRVGRGWTAERLIRTLGEPVQVTGGPPGPTTWSYPQGRAVTLDERGRVVSAVGF